MADNGNTNDLARFCDHISGEEADAVERGGYLGMLRLLGQPAERPSLEELRAQVRAALPAAPEAERKPARRGG